jgi:histidinol-phosphate/aromatic aminotransferase/cobyric acid decarboxylase-like protein
LSDKLIDLTSGVNPLGPSNKARNAIRSRVRDIPIFGPQYLNHLKRYVAKKERATEACIAFGCGSTAILNTVVELTQPKRILIPYPFSQRHNTILKKHSLESTTVALRANENFDLNIDEFCNAMHGCNAALLSNPHDVTGSVVSPNDITKVVDEADRLGMYLFVDESYAEYAGMPSLLSHVTNSGKVVILRTFSAFYALGALRLGYIIGPPSLISLVEARLDPSWINLFAPWAAIASMKDTGYRRRTLLFIEGEKAYLREKLSRIKEVKCYISPSNILVIRLHKEYDNVHDVFKKHHALIDPFTDDEGNACIRFPVQNHRLNAHFVRTLRRIMEA